MTEQQIQQRIRIACSRGAVRLWRNNVGKYYAGDKTFVNKKNLSDSKKKLKPGDLIIKNPHLLSYGLCVGSSDLIGLRTLIITEDMVGKKIGQFVGKEVKRRGGRATPEQSNWLATVREMGGLADLVHSVEEAEALLRAPPP